MGTNELWEKLMLKYKGKRLTRGRAIKLYCKLECCAGDTESWKECPVENCFLWKFRTGREILHSKPIIPSKKASIVQGGEQKTLSENKDEAGLENDNLK